MRTLLSFVTVLAVMGVFCANLAVAADKPKCSNKAYSTFQNCLETISRTQGIGAGEMAELYSSWELETLSDRLTKCLRFMEKKSRWEACKQRWTEDFLDRVLVKEKRGSL